MKLISPTLTLKEAFIRFYDDVKNNDVENAVYYLQSSTDFEQYIQSLENDKCGINLPEGYVPCSHFWLVNTQKEILGVIRIRHHINNEFLTLEGGHIGYDIAPSWRKKGNGKAILKLVLPEVKKLGIQRILVTADEDNFASRKIIETNGGQLDNIVMGNVFPNLIARYWITCS